MEEPDQIDLDDKSKKFRVRFRVRFGKPFTSDDTEMKIDIGGRSVVARPQKRDQTFKDTEWVVMIAGGFSNAGEAQSFGDRLKIQTQIAALVARLGVDIGKDQSTTWMNEEFARASGFIEEWQRIHPNVHGLIIVPDDEANVFPLTDAKLSVTSNPDHFFGALQELSASGTESLGQARQGVQLLNAALMADQPLAQLVLAISAVEALGQSQSWTETQVGLIKSLIESAKSFPAASESERTEVADSLAKGMFRVSLRQGVMRKLRELGLDNKRAEWDRIYKLRSGIFHGTTTLTDSDISQLALDATTLCIQIIISLLKLEGAHIPSVADVHFGVEKEQSGKSP